MPFSRLGCFVDWLCPIVSALILAISSGLTVVDAQNVDFKQCWNESISKLNTSDMSDTNQCFRWDKARRHRIDSGIPFVTFNGCKALCGSGYELWPVTETLQRLALFIVPLIVLALRFAYAQVGTGNVLLTFVHLLGDPLDSLWSLLTRQELARRNYNLAAEIAPTAAKDIATVWTAYDQWWQGPIKHFRKKLEERMGDTLRRPEMEPSTGTQSSSHWSPAPKCILDLWDKCRLQVISTWGSCGLWWNGLWGRNSIQQGNSTQQDSTQNNGSNRQGTYVPGILENNEVLIIKKASRNLSNNREGKLLSTWITIIIFLISLTIAYLRSAREQINSQTAHTIAVVMLFSHLVFAVYISGHVGNFKDPDLVLNEISELNHRLPDLFPQIRFTTTCENTVEDIASSYFKVAPWVGINNSWRPTKTLDPYDPSSDRSSGRLFGICFMVLGGSWLSAFLVSYLTPVVGIGCRSFGWSMIALGWLLSAIFDFIFGATLSGSESLWYTTLAKDGIFMLGTIITVLLAQSGIMNNCFCRASIFLNRNRSDACINLGPVTDTEKQAGWLQWVIIPICGLIVVLLGVFSAGYEGEHGRLLFHRASGERHAELIAIKNLEVIVSKGESEGLVRDGGNSTASAQNCNESMAGASESSTASAWNRNIFVPEVGESSTTSARNRGGSTTEAERIPSESHEMVPLLQKGKEPLR